MSPCNIHSLHCKVCVSFIGNSRACSSSSSSLTFCVSPLDSEPLAKVEQNSRDFLYPVPRLSPIHGAAQREILMRRSNFYAVGTFSFSLCFESIYQPGVIVLGAVTGGQFNIFEMFPQKIQKKGQFHFVLVV